MHAVSMKRAEAGCATTQTEEVSIVPQEYGKLLGQFQIQASMSGKRNCYDNAPMESFWGTLKTALVFHRRFRTRQDAIREIMEYIEPFYNCQKKQKNLAIFLQSPSSNGSTNSKRQLKHWGPLCDDRPHFSILIV